MCVWRLHVAAVMTLITKAQWLAAGQLEVIFTYTAQYSRVAFASYVCIEVLAILLHLLYMQTSLQLKVAMATPAAAPMARSHQLMVQ